MKISHYAVAIGLFLSLVGSFFLYLPNHIIGSSFTESSEGTQVRAGSHPAVIVWAVIVILLYIVLLNQPLRTDSIGQVSLKRRFFSFLIDFTLVLATTSSIDTLFPLFAEARRIGHFEWSFTRDYSVSTDSMFILLVLLSFVEMFFYFAYPLTKGKQTIGEYVLRMKVAPPFGLEGRFTWGAAIKRVWYSFMGLCTSWNINLNKLDQNGQTWYDRATNCTVSLVEYDRDGSIDAS